MADGDLDLADFLERYAATLSAFDATAAASLWATPGMIVDDRSAGVLDSREAMARGLEQSYPLYRRLGLASVDFEVLEQRRLSDAVAQIHVRWLFCDDQGALLTDSAPHYVLRRDEAEGWLVCVCIQTDDLEKLQALAAARRIDLDDVAG